VALVITSLLVGAPIIGLLLLATFGLGDPIIGWTIAVALFMYVVSGLGVTAGFHRLFAHKGYTVSRPLKIALAVAGSLALQGSLIGWVAVHRHHHVASDQPGDPHSPLVRRDGPLGAVRGFVWAHVGWLFSGSTSDAKRYAPDLVKDHDLVVIDRLFPVLAIGSLAIPFGVGWAVSGTLAGALAMFIWAGLVRMAVLHHVTWSINSVCHLWGRRPFRTSDHSTNFAPLALFSFGESWHNFHHAAPASARHGVLAHQVDLSAGLIKLFERAGWATKVRWPSANSIAAALACNQTP
jgi:stearoyl-CoA desaturase (delta-9 desaturase)